MSLQASLVCACMLGLSMGEAGVSIMHDVNHGAGLPSKRARYVMGAAMDLVSLFLLDTADDCDMICFVMICTPGHPS